MASYAFLVCASIVILFAHSSTAAKILFFCGFSTYSHRILVWPLIEELTSRGHQVTYFSASPNRQPNPTVSDFVPLALTNFYKGEGIMNVNLLHSRLDGKLPQKWEEMTDLGQHLCKLILTSPDTREWADRSHFDLIFIDALFNDCGFAFVHKYKAKHILFGTTTIFTWNYDPMGILPETNWIPDFIYHYPAEDMPFWHRLVSTLENVRWYLKRQYIYLPRIEEIIRQDFGLSDMPPISELEKNVSLFFTNTHFSEEYARALPPFVIPVGGMHIRAGGANQSEIPEDIKSFITSRKGKGFIYISFGSDTPISTLPPKQMSAIFGALEETQLPCIWKWDGSVPEGVPKNILMAKWLPQQALLCHPEIKMMITHGGLLSIHEALHHKVPLLVIPIFAEQDFNAERVHRKGFGLKLEVKDLTKEDLTLSIGALLTDRRYKTRTEEVSRVFSDRQNSPLDTAVWYTEYVLRQDTSFMKPYSMHQTWYQRRLLDVWGFVAAIAATTIILLIYILKTIFRILKTFFKVREHGLSKRKVKNN